MGSLAFQPYNAERKNILVIGPLPGKKYQEIVFPILSPDPTTQKGAYFLKYSLSCWW